MTRPTLIVIPPAGGITPLLDPFLEAIAPHLDAIPIDRKTNDDDGWLTTTRDLARDALERWDAAATGRAHVFGISLGGMIAQWLAIDAPDRVDHLVLASTAARAIGVLEDRFHGARLARCLVRPRAEAAVCMAEGVLSARLDERTAEALRAHPASRRHLLREASAAARHDAREALGRIGAPTVVLTGSEDRLIAYDAQAELASRIAGARHVTLEGLGHDLTAEAPERTARAVLDAIGVGSSNEQPGNGRAADVTPLRPRPGGATTRG